MKLATVIGKVWASTKDPKLKGMKLYIIQPIDQAGQKMGRPLVAPDGIGVGEGDTVYWVGGSEATLIYEDRQIPSDVTIVGLVDRLDD